MKKIFGFILTIIMVASTCFSQATFSTLTKVQDVKPISTSKVDKLLNLQSISFKYTAPTNAEIMPFDSANSGKTQDTPQIFSKEQYSFQIDNIKSLFPDLVTDDGHGNSSINYNGLIPILIQTIQQQQKTILLLQQDIVTIKGQLKMPVTKEIQTDQVLPE